MKWGRGVKSPWGHHSENEFKISLNQFSGTLPDGPGHYVVFGWNLTAFKRNNLITKLLCIFRFSNIQKMFKNTLKNIVLKKKYDIQYAELPKSAEFLFCKNVSSLVIRHCVRFF